jgi:Tfp pilus assembly protein FimT
MAVVGDNVSNMSSNQQGFTVAELVVICAIIGIVSTIAIPTFMNALQTMRSRGAVAEMKTGLNRAKQLAITTRQNICVQAVAGGGYRFLLGGCLGGAWIGTGTTAAGNLILSNNVAITNGGNGPVFTPLGTVTNGVNSTFTLAPPAGPTSTVTVTPAGRITSP